MKEENNKKQAAPKKAKKEEQVQLNSLPISEQIDVLEKEKRKSENNAVYMQGRIDQLKTSMETEEKSDE